jgi:hypothetical protein
LASEAKGRGFDPRQPHHFFPFINAKPMPETLVYWAYRASAYVVLNLGEDAALVAIFFC